MIWSSSEKDFICRWVKQNTKKPELKDAELFVASNNSGELEFHGRGFSKVSPALRRRLFYGDFRERISKSIDSQDNTPLLRELSEEGIAVYDGLPNGIWKKREFV
jgi:hypothetical protein